MPAPEINVRLTADGVQDVVNAFKRVQQEAKETKEKTALLSETMQQLGELMPVLSIGLAVEKMVELGKSAMESTVNIGRLAEKTGASVGTLSVLAMAAHDAGIEQDALGQSLVRLARSQEQASTGNAKSRQAFQALGISLDDLKKKNPADMLVEVAQHLQANIPDGAQRAAVAMQLFGRGGASIIPLLDEIGQADGFERAKERAQELGLYLSDDFVAQAKQGEEAIREMQDITQGFAMQFMAGFMPQATKAVADFAGSITSKGGGSLKDLGNLAGNVVRGIVNVFLVAGQTIGAVFASIADGAVQTFKTVLAVAEKLDQNDFKGAWNALKGGVSEGLSRQGSIWSGYGSMVKAEYSENPEAPKVKHTGGGTGGSGDGTTQADKDKALREQQKLIDARVAYEDAVANAELQKQKLRDQQAEAEDKSRYDAGLETLTAYYDARAARINAEADAEQSILEKKLANEENAAAQLMGESKDFIDQLIKQGPEAVEAAAGTNTQALAMLQKVAATRAQMDEQEIKRQTELAKNETERHQAEVQANQRALTDRQKLYELEGNTSAAQQLALERELQQTDELLTKLGVAEDERAAILNRARVNATARNQIGALGQSGQDEFSSLQTATAAIQDKANAGLISQVDAEAQIYRLEAQRLPVLQSIVQQMSEAVDNAAAQLLYLQPGTDDYNAQLQVVNNLQRQVDQYTRNVDSLGTSLHNATCFTVELSNRLTTEGTGAVVGFFDAWSQGSKSFSGALADIGKTFEQILTHMIDQMMVYYALMALVGWLAPGSSFYTSLSKSGPFGGLMGHADGGYTGNVATNKVAGIVHGKEFVLNAAATSRWGLPLLQAMNAGTIGSVASSSTYSSLGSMSDGGGDSGPLVELNIDTNGQPAQTSRRTGPNGQSIIDVVIGQVASDIASGGKVGQSIQSTFGVSRKGNIRG
jgi:hypothetical protein